MFVCLLAGTPSLGAAETDKPEAWRAQPVTQRPRTPVRDPAAELARHLNLDASQLTQVRQLLAIHKAQIRNVWSDASIQPDDRVGAAKAIHAKTVAQIRALLTEEQRQKYFQPLPARSLPAEGGPGVEDWMHALRPQTKDTDAKTPAVSEPKP